MRTLTTQTTIKHLAIELGQTQEESAGNILNKIDLKQVSEELWPQLLGINIVHKAMLINRALSLIYNHVFMALPVQEKAVEIQLFLSSKTVNQEKIKKRRLVSWKRLSAMLD